MKQRAGLGKKVSSIFDGVPLPNAAQEIEQAPKQAQQQLPPVHRPSDIAAGTSQAAVPTPPA